jgi:NadR type nicotinamide-nucleotide adenylyltransferase
MKEICPRANVVHVAEDDLPQDPSESLNFWDIWKDVVRRHAGHPRYVFASEQYGYKLAEVCGATCVPCDIGRISVPVSGTAVRADPMKNWEYIPECVRPYYVKKVCVFGPESTGKTTLARNLANHYKTVWVPEYARVLLDPKLLAGGKYEPTDVPMIVEGQVASEDALARQANRVLICDTDVLTSTIWSNFSFGYCSSWIEDLAAKRTYDLYLLADIDVPWVNDGTRYLNKERKEFFKLCEKTLRQYRRKYKVIKGNWDERMASACAAVDSVLNGN